MEKARYFEGYHMLSRTLADRGENRKVIKCSPRSSDLLSSGNHSAETKLKLPLNKNTSTKNLVNFTTNINLIASFI